jgi:hypothetical protein
LGNTDAIKLWITYITAALLAVGGTVLAAWAWAQPPIDPPRDLSILYGLVGLVVGSAITFLFGQESATRASRATERATEQGGNLGLSMPQAPGIYGNTLTGSGTGFTDPLGFTDPVEDVYDPEGDVAEAEEPDHVDPDIAAQDRPK